MNDEILDTLMRARSVIENPRHWIKGAFHSLDHQAHCVLGAVEVACGISRRADALHMEPHAYLEMRRKADRASTYLDRAAALYYGTNHVQNANDDPRTTHRDVMRIFDEAIELRRVRLGLPRRERIEVPPTIATFQPATPDPLEVFMGSTSPLDNAEQALIDEVIAEAHAIVERESIPA